MAAPRIRWLRFLFRIGCVWAAISFVWPLAGMYWPAPSFVGSPPRRHAVRRNSMDLGEKGWWIGKFGKEFRPSRRPGLKGWIGTLASPGLLAGPVVHWFCGWDVYADDVCVTGRIASLAISEDDGDVGFHLTLPREHARYAWRAGHPKDVGARTDLVVEIDYPIRKNFPVASDLAVGDEVRVCGRWVFDRGHDHNEIHPARWVEILDEAPPSP